MPLSLSDNELQIAMPAARPIHPRERDAFLREVVSELERSKHTQWEWNGVLVSQSVARLARKLKSLARNNKTWKECSSTYLRLHFPSLLCLAPF